jgi:pilus assembly protein TadC
MIDMDTRPVVDRIIMWLRRYLPAELIGMLATLLCAWLAIALTGSAAVAAIAGTWGDNLGFYGILLGRELARRSLRALPAILRDLVLEFGPATALDGLLLRPALLYAGMALTPHSAIGLIVAKLAADLVFYVPAIVSYELLRRRARPIMEELPL